MPLATSTRYDARCSAHREKVAALGARCSHTLTGLINALQISHAKRYPCRPRYFRTLSLPLACHYILRTTRRHLFVHDLPFCCRSAGRPLATAPPRRQECQSQPFQSPLPFQISSKHGERTSLGVASQPLHPSIPPPLFFSSLSPRPCVLPKIWPRAPCS